MNNDDGLRLLACENKGNHPTHKSKTKQGINNNYRNFR
jgi:hypothetical protein